MTGISTKADSVRVMFRDRLPQGGVGSRTTAFPLMTVTGAEGAPKNSSFFLWWSDCDHSHVREDYLVNDKQAKAKTFSGLS